MTKRIVAIVLSVLFLGAITAQHADAKKPPNGIICVACR